MNRLIKCVALVAVSLGLWACDSGGDDGNGNPSGNQNPIITGFYCVIEAPDGATVAYRITEFDQYGTPIDEVVTSTLTFETASAKVVDLYETGADPHGVAVMVKLTAGSGRLKAELWQDAALQASAETERANHEICVRGGTGS
ncbi:MAG TPA: hypothetical protein VMO47_18465 [Rhodothermales bacterium]|nr:hypothetical protein [Rhodothermales bacterium]